MKHFSSTLLATCLMLLFLAFAPIPSFAQTITATIAGTVTDPNGAVVPGATVTATSNDTSLVKTATTDDEGRYTLPFLQPGFYTIKVESSGFAGVARPDVKLEVAQTATLDFSLGVGGSQETVQVTDESASLLVTENPSLETTLENKLIEDLPSAQRNALSFLNFVPGVIDQGFALAQGENLNQNGNAQGPIGTPGNRNFFDSSFAVSGGQASTNDVLLDGVSNTVADFNGVAISPPQDSIREFKVLSGAYSAEYGRSGGGIVNIVTKAGRIDLNGALYEYFQNGGLNANGWQRNRRGTTANGTPVLPRIPIKRNQFGGAIGGPIFLPRFGEGGRKTIGGKTAFFFFNYEGRREKNPFSKQLTMPTARMRTGDLSELLQPNATRPNVTINGTSLPVINADGSRGIFGQVYSPYGALVPNGQRDRLGNAILVRQAIPGNRLDLLPRCPSGPRTSACLDPVGLNLLSYLPLPNQPGLIDNFVYSDTAEFTRDIVAARVDKTLSDKHSLFGRFSNEKRFQGEPSFLGSVASNARIIRDSFFNATFNDVYTFTPTAINNFRYGYTRVRANQVLNGQGFDPTILGLPAYVAATAPILSFPIFNFAGGAEGQGIAGEITGGQIGGGGNNQPRDTTTIADAVTLIKGGHTIKTGGEFRLLRFFAFQYNNPDGTYSYNRTFTRGPIPTVAPTGNAAEAGSSLASLLLGLPTNATRESVSPITLYHKYGAVFVQDDWKVRPNLTLNLGLRYDLETGTDETHGQITRFDLDAPSQLNGRVSAPVDPIVRTLRPNFTDLRGLLSFPNEPQTRTNKNRFAPRIGFAYRINDKTSIRGGYGIYYVPLSAEQGSALGVVFTTGTTQSNQSAQIVQPGGSGARTVFSTDPFSGGLPPPPGTSLGANTQIGQSPLLVEPNRRTAYTQQYNFVIQRQLGNNLVLDLAYVGSHGTRLPFPSINLNQLPPEYLDYARINFASARSATGVAATSVSDFFNQQVANPFFGIITNPNSPLISATVTRAQLLKPYPQYDNPALYRPLVGASKYNALQVQLQKRFSDGLSATASYTFSKAMDIGGAGNNNGGGGGSTVENIYDIASDYTISNFDIPHRFTAAFSYEVPFGRGRRFGSGLNRFTNALLGGFQITGTASRQSGGPVGITAPGFGLSYAVRRANVVDGIDRSYSASEIQENIRNEGFAFNPDAFTNPSEFTLGNSARNYSDLRRDTYKNIDIGVVKNFRFKEDQKLQLRAEFVNAFNFVVFGTPGRDVSDKDTIVNGVVTRRGNFGRVTTQGNTPRNIQLVVRYTF